MKKIISLLVMFIFLVSCGSDDDEKNPDDTNNPVTPVIVDEPVVENPNAVVEETLSEGEIKEILDAFF